MMWLLVGGRWKRSNIQAKPKHFRDISSSLRPKCQNIGQLVTSKHSFNAGRPVVVINVTGLQGREFISPLLLSCHSATEETPDRKF